MGAAPDYVRLTEEVMGLRNVPPALARRLVLQGLVVEDRRDSWRQAGERICVAAPERPGVYVLQDASLAPMYVGKAINLRRRLRAHFAPRRWRRLSPELARVAHAEWQEVGSELESLLLEAEWIRDLSPPGNIQVAAPVLDTRAIPAALLKDSLLLLPSIESDSVELVATLVDGRVLRQRTRRNGADLAVHAQRLWKFQKESAPVLDAAHALAPIVFSWLAQRGSETTRIVFADLGSVRDLQARLEDAFAHRELFSERIVVL